MFLCVCVVVLLRWQDFADRSMAVFFDMPPRWWWRISVGVKARVVNGKRVDVAVWLSLNVLIAQCMRQCRVH